MALWVRFRALPAWVLPLLIGIIVVLLPLMGIPHSVQRQVQLTLILALVVSGLNLSLGYAGELALGQAAMYAAGAYTAGLMSKAGQTEIIVQLVAGALAALIVGWITGIAGLRLGGWSLAMTSFFLVLLLPDVLAIFKDITGGRNGLSGIAPPTLFGQKLTGDMLFVVVAVVVILWFIVVRNIIVSRHGVAFRALKRSPVLASSLGISVFRMKLLAYALGAVPAGLAGVLFANVDRYVSGEAFAFAFATSVLAASILGGSASIYGALIGAAILQFAANSSRDFQEYSLVFTGIFLIVGGVFLTGGIAGLLRTVVSRLDVRAARTGHMPPVASLLEKAELVGFSGKRLVIDDVSKTFGGNKALRGVSLVAEPGKVTAVIGPNGSGKTTLLNMVCGFYKTDSGTISLDGRRLESNSPDVVSRAGVARTFQTPNIPDGVSVFEAVIAGRYISNRASILAAVLQLPSFRRVRREDRIEAERVLAMVGLTQYRDVEAVSLPLGMRRMLEVARCLISRPGVLLLDEVASGLDEHEVELLSEVVRKVTAAGGTVVLVEHNFQLVLSLADRIVALAHGGVMANGTPAEIEANPRVLNEYLGVEADEESIMESGVQR